MSPNDESPPPQISHDSDGNPDGNAQVSTQQVPESPDSAEPGHAIAFQLTVHFHNTLITLPFYTTSTTLQDLSDTVAEELHVPPRNQKFLITPKVGLLKPPFKPQDAALEIHSWAETGKKVVLMGATSAEVDELATEVADRHARMARRSAALQAGRKVHASKARDSQRIQDEAKYTFHTLRPLPYLPNPEKSMRFLERLRDDAGIKRSMRTHGFSVGLLTEMNPAEHTTHESKTLGLNRNRGEVIELRLRTDAYDGYRDYKVIRKTLCHELAHNVWGPHDRNFWKLCREIEDEVDKNDWRRGGHSVGQEEFYNPRDGGVSDEEADGGGWEGGEYVLGGTTESGSSSDGKQPLDRREIMARAAEERMKKLQRAKEKE
nr:ubiquitin and wlm domain-containing metalloprotease [Quercus suber]